jgi:hypothetical protein
LVLRKNKNGGFFADRSLILFFFFYSLYIEIVWSIIIFVKCNRFQPWFYWLNIPDYWFIIRTLSYFTNTMTLRVKYLFIYIYKLFINLFIY